MSSQVFRINGRICSAAVAMLVMVVMVGVVRGKIELPKNETIPAVIAFGDSIIDTGNNNVLNTLIKCDFLPYGRDFEGGKPTGRFSNGKVPCDLIAEQLGIKETVPAYLDPNLRPEDMVTGVSFASGGSGFDPLTPKLVSVMSMSDQLTLFKEYIGKLKAYVGEDKTNTILAKSLVLVVTGSDDIANTYFGVRLRELQYDVPSYTSFMASSASDFLKELYELGARRIAVFSTPPIGCLPSQRTLAGLLPGCVEQENQAAQLFNTKLSSEIDSLNSQLAKSKIVYVDVYNPVLDLIRNPQKHGLTYADKGCCGTGTIEVTLLCNQYEPYTCTNASDYVFWDSYHPTEKAYKALILPLMNKYVNKFL